MAHIEVLHETRYAYSALVQSAQHLAHLRPLHDARQQLRSHELLIEPEPVQQREGLDAFGNSRLHFSLLQPHRSLRVLARSTVLLAPVPAPDLARCLPWEAVRDRLRYTSGAALLPAVEFVQPSRHVPRLAGLLEYARPSFAPGRPVAEGAQDLMLRIHADFAYLPQSTDIHTPLSEVLQQRRGVCQDFAHLMCGALRMLGLPARYVSGYLLTQSAPGEAALLGADASHAWVQVWCPAAAAGLLAGADAWIDFDPTNAVLPAQRHVRLAVGRDYADVAPLRGVIHGGAEHGLAVAVSTRLLDAGADAGEAAIAQSSSSFDAPARAA
jgi:transglutaminase-like putative cysteine protease